MLKFLHLGGSILSVKPGSVLSINQQHPATAININATNKTNTIFFIVKPPLLFIKSILTPKKK